VTRISDPKHWLAPQRRITKTEERQKVVLHLFAGVVVRVLIKTR
jgi:hypothetical protein